MKIRVVASSSALSRQRVRIAAAAHSKSIENRGSGSWPLVRRRSLACFDVEALKVPEKALQLKRVVNCITSRPESDRASGSLTLVNSG